MSGRRSASCRIPVGNPPSHGPMTADLRGHTFVHSTCPCLYTPAPLSTLPLVLSSVETMLLLRQDLNCGAGGGADTHFHLRIGSIFIILVGAGGGALLPVLIKRSKRISLPGYIFEYVHPIFPRLPVLIGDRAQVRKILWIWCNRASNTHPPKKSVS